MNRWSSPRKSRRFRPGEARSRPPKAASRNLSGSSLRAVISGRVQGLGFRPYVYRLARRMGIVGRVFNTEAGVVVIAQGQAAPRFLEELRLHPPPLASPSSFDVSPYKTKRYNDFAIAVSDRGSSAEIEVLPDLAICRDCVSEVRDRRARRWQYAFTNCTQCGPRYTIVEGLPYDRARTTMRGFRMCLACRAEYENPADRRFHAQPIACPNCGPRLTLLDRHRQPVPGDPLLNAAQALARGKVVALKSLGGFHLAADAASERAIRRLRRSKDRAAKPLALMCASAAAARLVVRISRAGLAALRSIPMPIVLLPKREPPCVPVSPQIAPGNCCLGVMLPYAPLHVLLLDAFQRLTGRPAVLVMTSANRRDEPIVADQDALYEDIAGAFDLCLTHDRPIANRCDDSVVMPGSEPAAPAILVRRSRGYAPEPLRLSPVFHVKQPVLAVGAELRNCFALAAGTRVFVSPHAGDLSSPKAAAFFESALNRMMTWTGIRPRLVACDLHPDFLSTRLAEALAVRFNARLVRVQHHYAHILSVMAEHGRRGPVLGLACDGTGYGLDGAVWGCELLLVRRDRSWSRLGHLQYLRHPEGGGELADPCRVARAYLSQCHGDRMQDAGIWSAVSGIRQSRHPVVTSSLGRLFDAVAAVSGVCRHASFAGQAAMALEAAARSAPSPPRYESLGPSLDPRPLLSAIAADRRRGVLPQAIAAGFHDALVRGLSRAAIRAAKSGGATTVCLSGGSFQNRLLRGGLTSKLTRAGLAVCFNQAVPLNDGGVALGQVVAAGPTADDHQTPAVTCEP